MSDEKIYNRFKIGRPARFEKAEDLWREALEYFEWCDEHPLITTKQRKKKREDTDEQMMERQPVSRPYTLDGLCLWLNIQSDWSVFKSNYKRRKDWSEFERVTNACEQCVRSQQVTGAMIGMYDPRLTARLNGITDKVELDNKVRQTTLTFDEFQRLLNGEKID